MKYVRKYFSVYDFWPITVNDIQSQLNIKFIYSMLKVYRRYICTFKQRTRDFPWLIHHKNSHLMFSNIFKKMGGKEALWSKRTVINVQHFAVLQKYKYTSCKLTKTPTVIDKPSPSSAPFCISTFLTSPRPCCFLSDLKSCKYISLIARYLQ
jgi:hypothetical protein